MNSTLKTSFFEHGLKHRALIYMLVVISGAQVGFCRKAYGQRPLTIPFSQQNGFLIVEVVLNDLFPVRLIFDTGSEYTILTEPITFAMLQAEGAEPIRLVGSDLSTSIVGVLSRRNRLQLGGVDISAQPIIAVESSHLDISEIAGEGIFGLMGMGSFGAYVVEIDYAQETIRLSLPGRFRPPPGAIALPIQVEQGKAYLKLFTKVHSAYQDSLNYLIDSGAALEMLLYAAPQDSSIYPPHLIAGSIGYGLGGELRGYVGRTDSLRFGSIGLGGIITHFQVEDSASLRQEIVARSGIIGNRLLSRFNIAIDLPGEMLYLSPRRGYNKPRPYDRSGLRIIRDGPQSKLLRIQFVAPGTPAAEIGLRAGDRIRRVNRRPVATLSLNGIQMMLRSKPGRRIRLQYERNGEVDTVEFRLRELI